MIHAAGWLCGRHCGWVGREIACVRGSPDLASIGEVMDIVGRPLKYFSRMTMDVRAALCAVSFALEGTDWHKDEAMTIGMIAGGYDTAAWAQQKYFDDYAANGRLLGRANLFIYTLPTSPMAEIAIPLWLNGPLIHVQDEASPVEGLLGHAREMIADSEAGGMLVLWADHEAAVCIAVGPEEMESRCGRVPQSMEAGPLELANRFREVARTEL